MKKIILLLIVGLTTLMSIEFTMLKSGLYPNVETQTPATNNWVEAPLPTTAFNVLDYGLKGDGVTDDSAALKELAKNTDITNWYFPAGKTFRLWNIDVPSHVEAVYGGANIKSIYTYDSSGYPRGAFWITSTIDGFVFDGLSFAWESDYVQANGSYGHITFNAFASKNDMENFEVRNCTFNGEFASITNDVKVAGANTIDNAWIRNAYFHDNTHINNGLFAYEITAKQDSANPDMGMMENIHIFNNDISGAGGKGISVVAQRRPSYIYNNYLHNVTQGIEITQCDGVKTYNNTVIASVDAILGTLSGNINAQYFDYGSNDLYDNHLEGNVLYHNSSEDNVYHNFIDGNIYMQRRDSNLNIGANFYENTVVSGGFNMRFEDMDDGSFNRNDVYNTSTGGLTIIDTTTPSATIEVSDNNFYVTNSRSVCVDLDLTTFNNNTCTKNYTEQIPTSRPGAGLLP